MCIRDRISPGQMIGNAVSLILNKEKIILPEIFCISGLVQQAEKLSGRLCRKQGVQFAPPHSFPRRQQHAAKAFRIRVRKKFFDPGNTPDIVKLHTGLEQLMKLLPYPAPEIAVNNLFQPLIIPGQQRRLTSGIINPCLLYTSPSLT